MRVLVIGLRATGAVVATWLRERGDDVTVVEERPGQPGYAERRAGLEAHGVTVLEGEPDWRSLLEGCELVVPSPGVRPSHPAMIAARGAHVPVRGDLDLAIEAANVPVVVVTGTNGKSTVTTLISAMLEHSGLRAPAVGNIGRVALEALEEPADVIVVEASSFQLETVTESFVPAVAVLLNLAPDHLDWHGSYDAYVGAKTRVFAHQTAADVIVANLDDPDVVAIVRGARGRVVGFTLDGPRAGAVAWHGSVLLDAHGEALVTSTGDTSFSPHERANIAAAAAAAQVVGATASAIDLAVGKFTRLHHRTEPVGKAGDVQYVDDSKATNPHAAVAAVRGFSSVVLLAGGDSKGVGLDALAEVSDRLRAVVAIGDTPEEVERVFDGRVPTRRATTMREAVRTAAGLARAGDVVLLSPACASFDWYESYGARGDDFRREVESLIAAGEAAQ